MTREEFSRWLEENAPALDAWGSFVVQRITARLRDSMDGARFEALFKVPPYHRRKTVTSALAKLDAKAGKYSEPTEQMTDLVGARFVVLLRSDIPLVERAIADDGAWVPRRDRSFEHEQDEAPKEFDYQSVHYLLRNPVEREESGITIPEGMTCEVQVRTLLQHAYAELVHDRIYKSKGAVTPPSVSRLVARCMALMETTDDMFCEAVRQLESVNTTRDEWYGFLDEFYGEVCPGSAARVASNVDAVELLDSFSFLLVSAPLDQVRSETTQFVRNKVRQRAGDGGLFANPVVFVVYWLVKNRYEQTLDTWNFPKWRGDLEQIAADLGRG